MEPTRDIQERLRRVKNTNIQYKDPNTSNKAKERPSTDKMQMGLRGLKIIEDAITLPRPSQKGNLANVGTSTNLQHRANGCRQGREEERRRNKTSVSTEGTYSRD